MDEDRLFNLKVNLCAPKTSHIDKAFYTWVRYQESTSNTDGFDLAQRAINRLMWIIGLLEEKGAFERYLPTLRQLVAFDLQTLLPAFKSMPDDYTEKFKSMLKHIGFPVFSADYDLGMLSRKRVRILRYLLKIMK